MTILEGLLPGQSAVLPVVWFILVAVLWIGFFFLEGFDFGVGMLVPFLGKNDQGRRLVINTVGPHWDGNEVWLLTAGGAMFAAFPGWYSTLFSGLYLPLFLVLVGLILRGVAFEYRSKRDSKTWRTTWDWLLSIGSLLPPLVFGVGFAAFMQGIAVKATTSTQPLFSGSSIVIPAVDGPALGLELLLSPFNLIGGLLFVGLCLAHGAFFIALKTRGDDIHVRAQKFGGTLAIVAGVLALVLVVWGNLAFNLDGQVAWLQIAAWVAGILAVVCVAFAWFMNSKNRDGWAFVGTALATVLLIAMFFARLFPGIGFADTSVIDLYSASSSNGTLQLMTIAACCLVPIVLAYTVWSYFFVFRRRLSTANIPALEVTTAA